MSRYVAVVMAAGAIAAWLPATASAADRTVTVTTSQNASWQGPAATGANVNYNGASGEPCGKTPADYCDVTLVNVDVPADTSAPTVRGVEFSATDFSPSPSSDFDLYVYKSDASGNRGKLVASSADVPGAEESTTVSDASGYYLVQVVYWAVTQSSYKGAANLLPARDRFPEDDDVPAGLQEFLASDVGAGWKSRSEPHIAQSPLDPNLLIAGSKFYNRDRDSLTEYEFKIGTYVSFDGGKTWSDLGQLNTCPAEQAPPESWPNNNCYPADDPDKGGTGPEDVKSDRRNPITGTVTPDQQFDDRGSGDFGEEYIVSDPWFGFDDEGTAYAMVLDAPPFDTGIGWGMTFHRWETPSPADVKAGNTWSNRIPINKYDDPASEELFLDDKNTFAVNNAGPDRDGKPGIIITCWGQNIEPLIKQQTVCERSTDGGKTWPEQPVPVSDVQQLVIGVHVVADNEDPNTFYATWLQYASGILGPSTLEVARTTDGGRTWVHNPKPAAVFTDIPRTFPGQSFRNLSIPIAAVGPKKGELYITYAEYRDAPQPGDADEMQSDIMMVKSTDGGQTFGPPVKVNQDQTNADQFQQYITVTPAGQLNVAFFDRRLDDPGRVVSTDPGNFFIDTWLARSDDGGKSWDEVRLSHDAWDPTINPPKSPSGDFIGDYQGLVADNCNAIPFVNDTHLANDPARDPDFDQGMPRSEFQQVFAWRVANRGGLGGDSAACREFGPQGSPQARAKCNDQTRPRSSISNENFTAKPRRLMLTGRTTDRTCSREGRIVRTRRKLARVEVTVITRAGKKCRFLEANGRLSKRRKCGKVTWLKAKSVKFDPDNAKTTWRLTKTVRLPKGRRYNAVVRGIDRDGNVERKKRRTNRAKFKVR